MSLAVGEYKHLIQRIRFSFGVPWDGRYGYRTGYYTLSATAKRLTWGQYTQFLTQTEYRKLLAKARAKGWPLF